MNCGFSSIVWWIVFLSIYFLLLVVFVLYSQRSWARCCWPWFWGRFSCLTSVKGRGRSICWARFESHRRRDRARSPGELKASLIGHTIWSGEGWSFDYFVNILNAPSYYLFIPINKLNGALKWPPHDFCHSGSSSAPDSLKSIYNICKFPWQVQLYLSEMDRTSYCRTHN